MSYVAKQIDDLLHTLESIELAHFLKNSNEKDAYNQVAHVMNSFLRIVMVLSKSPEHTIELIKYQIQFKGEHYGITG